MPQIGPPGETAEQYKARIASQQPDLPAIITALNLPAEATADAVRSFLIGALQKYASSSPILDDLQEQAVQAFRTHTEAKYSGFGMKERAFIGLLQAGKLTDSHVEVIGNRLGFDEPDRALLQSIRNNIVLLDAEKDEETAMRRTSDRQRSELNSIENDLLSNYEAQFKAWTRRQIAVREDAIRMIEKNIQ